MESIIVTHSSLEMPIRTKRRAAKACWSCRSRKVRCDALHTGIPCTNCRLDRFECVLADSHRRRRRFNGPRSRPADTDTDTTMVRSPSSPRSTAKAAPPPRLGPHEIQYLTE